MEEARLPVRDFGDLLLTPAFVNAHTHLALGFLRGAAPPQALRGNMVREFYFGIERNLEPEDVAAFTRMGAYESLLAGVGLVWDHYYHAEAVAEALASTGLAGVVAPTLQDLSGPGVQWRAAQLRATEAIARSTELRERGVVAAVGPHATDTVSEDLWRESCDLARSLAVPIHAHLAQSVEEHAFSIERRGASPARWLASSGVLEGVCGTAFAHAIYMSRPELALLDARRDLLVFCPCSQLVFGFPADPTVWEEAGLRWAVATDCSPSNDSMNVQKELRHVAGLRTMGATWSRQYRDFLGEGGERSGRAAGGAWQERSRLFERAAQIARPDALLARVWSIPGALHPVLRAGVLEEEALASFVVWDADHPSMWPEAGLATLAMGDTTQAIHAVFVAGREIGEPGDFQRSLVESDEYRRALGEASRRRQRLVARST
ncbi:MAG TPA: amidohydrolase family protein [Thermoanaerobaculia bacterium]|nr:amidohydrolase family protein [Thermoanaerobaculia bacterium]